jgi:hypothetical protein
MKKAAIIQTLLIVTTTICLGQVSPSMTNQSPEATGRSCKARLENKSIELCNMKADTVTYDRLKSCPELTVRGDDKQVIISYILTYILSDGQTVMQFPGTGNRLSDEMVAGIISSGITKITVEQVIGTDGSENINLGYRWFYFR